ncbi:hypothetical protein SAMN04488587_0653 [Methanococcoides vulcani]|uniref:Uncharacterized protein n=1 Tax=Methanococcoides vulcani TaxID=1353158 RepID=A0A1H9YMD8_9EURY|nr:hypothetical protein SAMN04488587_0653 [Methanococcoides vulcani]
MFKIINNENAASLAIAEITMLAIGIIIAAVLAAYALGM